MQPQDTQDKASGTSFVETSAAIWLQRTAFSGAAATVALPLVSHGLTANAQTAVSPLPAEATSPQQITHSQSRHTDDAVEQGQALQPQVETGAAVFSTAPMAVADKASAPARSSARSQAACSGLSCKGIKYIELQLSKVQAEVQALQSQIQSFEVSKAQTDIAAYRKLIAERQAEIAQQKQRLGDSVRLRQKNLADQKLQLARVGALGDEVNFAERVLSQTLAYQQSWSQIQRVEKSLAVEFGNANLDGTALNEIYSDYTFHQEELSRIADEAVGGYIANNTDKEGTVPQFIKDNPATLGAVQQLAISTYEYQIEQLRLATITEIEQKLNAKQRQLISDVGEFESLQRDLVSSQKLLNQYEQAKAEVVSQAPTPSFPQQELRDNSVADQSVLDDRAQGVLYTTLAASAVAVITARRRDARRVVTIPQLDIAVSGAAISANTQQQIASAAATQPDITTEPTHESATTARPQATTSDLPQAPSPRSLFDVDIDDSAAIAGLPGSQIDSPEQQEIDSFFDTTVGDELSNEMIDSFFDMAFEEALATEITVRAMDAIAPYNKTENNLANPEKPSFTASTQLPSQTIYTLPDLTIDWIIQDFDHSPAIAPLNDEADIIPEAAQTIADMAANGEGSIYVRPIADSTHLSTHKHDQMVAAAGPTKQIPVKHPRTLAEAAAM